MPADLRYAFLVDWLDPQASLPPRPFCRTLSQRCMSPSARSPPGVPCPHRLRSGIVTGGSAVVQAQLVRQYLLFYYTIDNTVEMVSLSARCFCAPPLPAFLLHRALLVKPPEEDFSSRAGGQRREQQRDCCTYPRGTGSRAGEAVFFLRVERVYQRNRPQFLVRRTDGLQTAVGTKPSRGDKIAF